eukprot:6181949-Pleurochrysis_carterae.AAC.2
MKEGSARECGDVAPAWWGRTLQRLLQRAPQLRLMLTCEPPACLSGVPQRQLRLAPIATDDAAALFKARATASSHQHN